MLARARLLLLLLAAGFVPSAATDAATTIAFPAATTFVPSLRDKLVLRRCFGEYLNDFTLEANASFAQYAVLKENLFWRKPQGDERVCDSFRRLQWCMGNTVETVCMRRGAFAVTLNATDDDSRGFVADYWRLEYICLHGHKHFTDVRDCIEKANLMEDLNTSLSVWATQFATDSVCDQVEKFTSNALNKALDQCDVDTELFMCHLFAKQIHTVFPDCELELFCVVESDAIRSAFGAGASFFVIACLILRVFFV